MFGSVLFSFLVTEDDECAVKTSCAIEYSRLAMVYHDAAKISEYPGLGGSTLHVGESGMRLNLDFIDSSISAYLKILRDSFGIRRQIRQGEGRRGGLMEGPVLKLSIFRNTVQGVGFESCWV